MNRRNSSSAHILDLSEADLYSVQGAQKVIADIASRNLVSKLILGHNKLGDDGCVELFRYLSSDEGKQRRIISIALGSNSIGDAGLRSITHYLDGNETLQELFLQNNLIRGNEETASLLVNALNNSRLRTLSLASNAASDPFMLHFLSNLHAPSLRELHLSAMGISRLSVPCLLSYLSSPRCYPLATLKLNGNNLGSRSIRKIAKSIDKHNFTLTQLEMYASNLADRGDSTADSDDKPISNSSVVLSSTLSRNEYLKKQTEKESLALLRCARAVLLRSKSPPPDKPQSPDALFQFTGLPTELQLHILAFIAPHLSRSQRVRVFEYASDPSTLPSLLPRLGNSRNLERMVLSGMGLAYGEKERVEWFETVRCDYYDADGTHGMM